MSDSSDAPAAFLDAAVIVTGAGTGIGRSIARMFASEGANVLAIGRRLEKLEETAAGDPNVHPFAVDIAQPDAAREIAEHAVERLGKVDVLVNNAAVLRPSELGKLDPGKIQEQLSTNFVAPALLAQHLLDELVRTRGSILNITAAFGTRGAPGIAIYAGTKMGLEHMTRSWALELAPRGVRVNAISVGAVTTPVLEHAGLSPERAAAIDEAERATVPLGRKGRPQEIAWWVLQIARPEAEWVTGSVWVVDGGRSAGVSAHNIKSEA